MPKRWTSYVLQAGIVALGILFATNSLHDAEYIARSPLVRAAAESATPKASSTTTPIVEAGRTVAFTAGAEHERVKFWLDRLTTSAKASVASTLGRMQKYDDMILAKLEAREMPHDLIYLAMIESEFNPNARSPVHAVGMWQFMSATARQFGLTVRGKTDERRNPSRATDAALNYLTSLHDRFGSWYLAAAAYNSGEGTVSRALKRVLGQTKGTDADFFRIMPALPRETQDYVPKLIATAQIGNAPAQYGIVPLAKAPVTTKAKSATLVRPTHRSSHAASRPTARRRPALHGTRRSRKPTKRPS